VDAYELVGTRQQRAPNVLAANRNRIFFSSKSGQLLIATRRGDPVPLLSFQHLDDIHALRVLSYNNGTLLSFQYVWGKSGLNGVSILNLQRGPDGFFEIAEEWDVDFDRTRPD
jgi:hypothetical protein